MFFSRKGKLRKQFDERLLSEMDELKDDWQQKSALLKRSFDPEYDLIVEQKLSEAKYFYLFKELKVRQIKLKK